MCDPYNGNLTGQTWRGRDGVQRAYGYVYDPVNRLLQGNYVARAGGRAGTLATGTAWNKVPVLDATSLPNAPQVSSFVEQLVRNLRG